jgi:hypothetical protein
MARPQQPELARSAKTDLDPDHIETGLQGVKTPKSGGETGPVPPENQPGHHPPKEQDKPDLDAFAARLGTDPKAPTATSARKGARPRSTAAKAAPAKSAPTKAAPTKAGPAKAGPAKETTAKETTAKGTTAKGTTAKAAPGWPESAPAASGGYDDGGQLPAKAEDGHGEQNESRLIGLMLMPLRETVKRLEQLDETLTERLSTARRSVRRTVGLKDR